MAHRVATSEADVIDAVLAAREKKSALEIVGAGTKRDLGRPMETADILDVSALSGIVSYEPFELILTAHAATPVEEIVQALQGQRLGFEPSDWGPLLGTKPHSGTIGGAIATDLCGAAALHYGRVRNHLLGYRGVNGFGEAYKAGGKVVKNVTGFDLPKLMCGAFGTLGVLTEVTLRVFPKPAYTLGVLVEDIAPREGLALLRRIGASALEATGLAYIPQEAATAFAGLRRGGALIRVEGSKESLVEKRAILGALIAGYKFEDIADTDGILSALNAGAAFPAGTMDIWRIMVPPAKCLALVEALKPTRWTADWAGGLLWVGMQRGDNVHQASAEHEASATCVRASVETRSAHSPFPPQDEIHSNLTRTVKAAFDPLHLFNPGRMVEGI